MSKVISYQVLSKPITNLTICHLNPESYINLEVLNNRKVKHVLLLMLIFSCCISKVFAGEIRVAVASNFSSTIKEISERFEVQTGHKVVLAFGSTGKHYAQIKNGAPFHLFFAADVERPRRLEEEGFVEPGIRFTYALGKLVLWSPTADVVDAEGRVLNTNTFRHLAIANPKLAPYGKAAEQVMKASGVWEILQKRIVRGENISQAYQFVRSANAQLGFIAYAQIKQDKNALQGSFWAPPQSMYTQIEQQAVLLKDDVVARDFLNFVKGEQARMIIQERGYGVP